MRKLNEVIYPLQSPFEEARVFGWNEQAQIAFILQQHFTLYFKDAIPVEIEHFFQPADGLKLRKPAGGGMQQVLLSLLYVGLEL